MPQKQKLSIEKKIEIIRDCLKGRVGMSEAARRGGVSKETMRQWVCNYEADGAEAFLPHKNRVYSPGLKQQAVEEYLFGRKSQLDICKNIIFGSKRSYEDGSRCILHMETSNLYSFQEEEAT